MYKATDACVQQLSSGIRWGGCKALPHLIEVGGASLGRRVCLCVVHGPVLANEHTTLEDLDHLQGYIQGDGDQVAIQNEARNEGIYAHHSGILGVGV